MNLFNNIKNVDFSVTLGEHIKMGCEEFMDLIEDNTEEGCTYRFLVTRDGNPLTKNDVPYDSILFTVPIYGDLSEIDYNKGTETKDVLNLNTPDNKSVGDINPLLDELDGLALARADLSYSTKL